MNRKVLFAIGVSSPVGMASLPGVANALTGYETWAKSQGYEIHIASDVGMKPVDANRLRKSLLDMLDPNLDPISRLVLVFVGHGFDYAQDQVWILTDGPGVNTGRISRDTLRGSLRTFGIDQIAVISDACRVGQYFESGTVSVLDDRAVSRRTREVDLFSATTVNQPAFNINADLKSNQPISLFSSVMVNFLLGKDARAFKLENETLDEVTTQTLYNSLPDAVLMEGAKFGVTQEPQIYVGFKQGKDTYSSWPKSMGSANWSGVVLAPSVDDVPLVYPAPAEREPLRKFDHHADMPRGVRPVFERKQDSTFLELVRRKKQETAGAKDISFLNSEIYFAIEEKLKEWFSGSSERRPSIVAVVNTPLLSHGYIVNEAPTGSIASVERADSRWQPILSDALDEHVPYIGRRRQPLLTLSYPASFPESSEEVFVVVPTWEQLVADVHLAYGMSGSAGAMSVSWKETYTLSSSSGLNDEIDTNFAAHEALRMLESKELSSRHCFEVASRLREGKHANPLLGIVCAYLYDAAGDDDSINRMCRFYLTNGQEIPFDIALLARGKFVRAEVGAGWDFIFGHAPRNDDLAAREDFKFKTYLWEETSAGRGRVAGFAPLLRLGWPRLAARSDIKWAKELAAVSEYLTTTPIASLRGRFAKGVMLDTLEDLGFFEKRSYDWRP